MHTHFWLPHCFSKSVHYICDTQAEVKSQMAESTSKLVARFLPQHLQCTLAMPERQFECNLLHSFVVTELFFIFFTYRRSFLSVTIGGFVCLLHYFLWLLLNNVKSALWMCCMKLCTTVHALITFFPSPPHSQQSLQTDHRRHEQVIFFYHCLLTVISLSSL